MPPTRGSPSPGSSRWRRGSSPPCRRRVRAWSLRRPTSRSPLLARGAQRGWRRGIVRGLPAWSPARPRTRARRGRRRRRGRRAFPARVRARMQARARSRFRCAPARPPRRPTDRSAPASATLPLLVGRAPVVLDCVDDGHDRRIDGTILGDAGLPRRRSAGVEHYLAEACAHRVDGDDQRADRLPFRIGAPDEQELEPGKVLLLARGDDRSDDAAEEHPGPAYFFTPAAETPPSSPISRRASAVRPRGRAASMLAWGLGMTCTETSCPTRSAPRAPASVAAFTAATSPRTIAVT